MTMRDIILGTAIFFMTGTIYASGISKIDGDRYFMQCTDMLWELKDVSGNTNISAARRSDMLGKSTLKNGDNTKTQEAYAHLKNCVDEINLYAARGQNLEDIKHKETRKSACRALHQSFKKIAITSAPLQEQVVQAASRKRAADGILTDTHEKDVGYWDCYQGYSEVQRLLNEQNSALWKYESTEKGCQDAIAQANNKIHTSETFTSCQAIMLGHQKKSEFKSCVSQAKTCYDIP